MNFSKLAEENNWESKKNILYGERYGFLLTMAQNDAKVSVYLSLTGLTDEEKQKTLDDLNARQDELKTSFAFDHSVLYFRFTTFETDETITNTLDEVFNYLHNNLGYKKVCVYCGKDDSETYTAIRGIKYYAHAGCIQQQSQKEYHDQTKNRHYLQGTIGALIGGIIGTIPWIVVSVMGFYAAILGYLIGLSAVFGYRKFGGKLGSATRYIILLVVIIAVFVGEIGNLAVQFYQDHVPFTLDNFIYNIQNNSGILTDILRNLALGLIMGFLGVFGLFKRLKTR